MRTIKLLAAVFIGVTASVVLLRIIYSQPNLISNGRIAFQSNRDQARPEQYDIYVMNADGSELKRLTDTGNNKFPSFSPDGKSIAFASGRDGRWSLFVMDADGSNVHKLTSDIAAEYKPTWSPDGKRIAFATNPNRQFDVYAINVDGTGLVNLTQNPDDDNYPAWSPDGQHIAFSSSRNGASRAPYHQVYLMNANGKSPVKLTDYQLSSSFPVWSPDNIHLAFRVMNLPPPGWFVVDVQSGKSQQLFSEDFQMITWSPDGRYIAAVALDGPPFGALNRTERRGVQRTSELYLIEMATGKSVQITRNSYDDINPSWAPS